MVLSTCEEKIIPVIDLRRKFDMVSRREHRSDCIIVVDVQVRGQSADVDSLWTMSPKFSTSTRKILVPHHPWVPIWTHLYSRNGPNLLKAVTILLEIENVLSDSNLTRLASPTSTRSNAPTSRRLASSHTQYNSLSRIYEIFSQL